MRLRGGDAQDTQDTYVPLNRSPPQSPSPEKSSLISLVAACKRVGSFFDLWQDDPAELVRVLETAWLNRFESHSLGLLFEPPLPAVEEPEISARTSDANMDELGDLEGGKDHGNRKEIISVFEKGDLVKAKLSDEMKQLDDGGEKYIDRSRDWYHAEVVSVNRDGTYNIQWEHKYDGDTIKKQEELIPVFVGDEMDGVRTLLQNCKSSSILWSEIPIFVIIFAFIACLPEVIFLFTTRRNVCSAYEERREDSHMKDFCIAAHESRILGPVLDHTLGMLLGIGCILFVLTIGYILLPLGYHIIACFSEARAKSARRIVLLTIDTCHLNFYPQVYGVRRIRLIFSLGLSFLIACLTLAFLLIAPGVMPLGFISTQIALRIMNTALGDEVGLREMQEARILALLLKLMKRCEVDMSEEELRHEVDKLVRAPNDCCTLQISLGLVTLIASAVDSKHRDSKRVGQFLVSKAYAAFSHAPRQLAQLKARHDIIVDVFEENCQVPGLNLTGERWAEFGMKLPWHLCIDRQIIQHFEEELNALETIIGDGCFTWRSPRNGLWRTRENHHPSFRIAGAKKLVKNQYRIDATLNDLVHESTHVDKPKLTCALLKANANPNFRTDINNMKSSTFVRACMAGKLDSVNLLVEFKADIGREAREMVSKLETPHFQPIKEDVLKLLEERSKLPHDSPMTTSKTTQSSRSKSSRGSRSVGIVQFNSLDDDEEIKPESRDHSEDEDSETKSIRKSYKGSMRMSQEVQITHAHKHGAAGPKDFMLRTQPSLLDLSGKKGKDHPNKKKVSAVT